MGFSGALPADRDRPRVDADQVGAGAYTPDGPGAVVATRTLDDGAAVWSLQDARTAADLAQDGPARRWWYLAHHPEPIGHARAPLAGKPAILGAHRQAVRAVRAAGAAYR